jgi:DNA-binding PadR family transcriptional regulator
VAASVDVRAGLDSMDQKASTMTQDLVLLGILAGGPVHGYEIRRAIDEKLTPVVGLQPRSVYYALRGLKKRKLVSSRTTRTGKRPKKFVYKLTRKGHKELRKLLVANVEQLQRPYRNLDLSLFFMSHADHSACESALKSRLAALREVAAVDFGTLLERCGLPREECLMKIAEHNSTMLQAEMAFTRKLLLDLKRAELKEKKAARRRARGKRPS